MPDEIYFQPKMSLCGYRHNQELGSCNSLIYQTETGDWHHVVDDEEINHRATPQMIRDEDNH